jgi:predicted Zn-dependent protease
MRIRLLLILLLSAFLFLTGCATNPITGKSELMLISPDKEVQLGLEYSPVVERELGGKMNNPQIQSYIARIGAKIVSVSHTPSSPFKFAALNDKMVNAMALPGGYIYITRGMLKNLTSEAQMASILAHEAAHVTARHVASAMSTQIGIDLLLSVVATQTDMAGAAESAAKYSQKIIGLKFSRDHEREADTGGLDYLVKAGYNPNAFIEVMEILDKQSKSKPIEFLSSHPLPAKRKEDLKKKISDLTLGKDLKTSEDEYKRNVLDNL